MKRLFLKAGLVLIPVLLLLLAFYAGTPGESDNEGRLMINEVMTKNLVTLRRNGEAPDWIELYNGTGKSVSLEGWGLSDRKSDPYRWQFPKIQLENEEYLLIYAAEEPDADTNELYCGFALNSDGGSLYLTAQDGSPIDSISWGSMEYDVSYGRAWNDKEELLFFTAPTPGTHNAVQIGEIKTAACEETVRFSVESGVYSEEQVLELSCDDGMIVYTMDGSFPNENSVIYTHPIRLRSDPELTGTVVRAAVYKNNSFGPTNTQFYLINTDSYELPVVSLAVDPDKMFGQNGIWDGGALSDYSKALGLTSIGNYLLNEEIPANVLFMNENRSLSARVSLHGQGSRSFLKPKGMELEFDEPIWYEGKRYGKLLLRAEGSGEVYKHCKIDAYLLRVCENLDIGASKYRLINLFINENYYGIYCLQETDDNSFFERNYNLDKKGLSVFKYSMSILSSYIPEAKQKQGTKSDAEDYQTFYRSLYEADLRTEEGMEWVERQIDLNNFTDYMIAETFFLNPDWPEHNVLIWRDIEDKVDNSYADGRWRWKIYDLDCCLNDEQTDVDQVEWLLKAECDPENDVYLTRLLFQKLWQNQAYRRQWLLRAQTLMETEFDLDRMISIMDELTAVQESDLPHFYKMLYNSLFYYYDNMELMRDSLQKRHQWYTEWIEQQLSECE